MPGPEKCFFFANAVKKNCASASSISGNYFVGCITFFSDRKTFLSFTFPKQNGVPTQEQFQKHKVSNRPLYGTLVTDEYSFLKIPRFLHNTQLYGLNLFARAEFKLIIRTLSNCPVNETLDIRTFMPSIVSKYIIFLARRNSFILIFLQGEVVNYSEKRKESRNMIHPKPLQSSCKIYLEKCVFETITLLL